jgi:hypothetical protein
LFSVLKKKREKEKDKQITIKGKIERDFGRGEGVTDVTGYNVTGLHNTQLQGYTNRRDGTKGESL